MPDLFARLGAWGSREPYPDRTRPDDARQTLESVKVQEIVIGQLLGGNASRVFGVNVTSGGSQESRSTRCRLQRLCASADMISPTTVRSTRVSARVTSLYSSTQRPLTARSGDHKSSISQPGIHRSRSTCPGMVKPLDLHASGSKSIVRSSTYSSGRSAWTASCSSATQWGARCQ